MTESDGPRVTIIVVPREKFSCTQESLDSIIEHTEGAYELIYVDGHSPAPVRDYLARRCRERGFTLIRVERYLPTNVARNIALIRATGDYVVFIENDVAVSPGWLPPLVACAQETGAAVVSPLICQGTPVHTYIHCAGGRCGISVKEVDGRVERRLYEHIAKQKQLVSKVLPTLERKPTELAEFHCMLIRKSFLDQHGPLDPKVLNTREHIDFCIAVMQKGGEIWLEPSSIVTYLHDTSVQLSDLAFFMYRWSDQSERSSLLYLRDKWDLTIDHTFQQRLKNVGWRRRMHVIRPYIKSHKSGIGRGKPGKWLEEGVVRADRILNRLLFIWHERKPMPDAGEATRYG